MIDSRTDYWPISKSHSPMSATSTSCANCVKMKCTHRRERKFEEELPSEEPGFVIGHFVWLQKVFYYQSDLAFPTIFFFRSPLFTRSPFPWKLMFPMTSTSSIRKFKNEMLAKLFPTWMNFGALVPFPPVGMQSIKSSFYSKPVFPQYIVF